MKRLWEKWKGASFGTAKAATRPFCCLLDGSAWLNLHGEARLEPRHAIRALQRLARWSVREALRVEVFFCGEPLRKAGDGESFEGVFVRYARDRAGLNRALCARAKAAKKERYNPVIITQDPDLEKKAAALGADCFRPGTLRKGVEAGSEDRRRGGKGTKERTNAARRGRRRGSRRAAPADPKRESPESVARKDPVRTLIDVVE